MEATFVLVFIAFVCAETFSLSVHRQDYTLDSNPEYDFVRSLLRGQERHRVAREVDMAHPAEARTPGRRVKRCDDRIRTDVENRSSALVTKITKCNKWKNSAAYRDTERYTATINKKCCGDKAIVMTEEDQNLMKECEPHVNASAATACWMECMGQKKHTLDSDGYIVKQKFTQQYLTHFVDESIKDLTVKSIDECVTLANDEAKKMGPEETDGKKCNRATSLASLCVRYKVETGCPQPEKIKTEECDKVREDMKNWESKFNSTKTSHP